MRTAFLKFLSPLRMYSVSSSLMCKSKLYKELPSSLYILYENKKTTFSALDPYLDIAGTFQDIPKLKKNLDSRGLVADVDFLYEKSILFEKLKISIENNKIKLKNKDYENEDEVKAIKNQQSSAIQELIELEKSFLIPFLQLPNSLYLNVTTEDKDLFVYFSKPKFTFTPSSHTQIGYNCGELLFGDVSPTSYYLSGSIAVLELAVTEYLSAMLKLYKFGLYSNMDFAKTVLAEGCGIDINNLNHILKIENDKVTAENQLQCLVGGASLLPFVALLCKSTVTFSDNLPIKFTSIGRRYEPVDVRSKESLFNSIQTTSVNSFIAYPNNYDEESLLNEAIEMITHIYSQLGIHFKLVQYAASKLKSNESLAIGICLYSPHQEEYIEVGRISLYQTFISKRLLLLQDLGNKKGAFLGLMNIEIMNLRNWIACLIENSQTIDRNYAIPKCLQPFMYEIDCKYF